MTHRSDAADPTDGSRTCDLCTSRGQVHDFDPRRCQGHSTRRQAQCDRPRPADDPGKCASHGTAAGTPARAARDRRRAAARIRKEAERHVTYGRLLDIGPVEALLLEVKWTAGHVAWLRARVQEFETGALSWGKSGSVERSGGGSARSSADSEESFAAAPPVLLDLYQRERRHLVDVCVATIKAGVEERLVQLAEQEGALLVRIFDAVFARLELSVPQWELVRTVVPEELERAAAGGAG